MICSVVEITTSKITPSSLSFVRKGKEGSSKFPITGMISLSARVEAAFSERMSPYVFQPLRTKERAIAEPM